MKPLDLLLYVLVFCAVIYFATTCGEDTKPVKLQADYKKAADSLKSINKLYAVAVKFYKAENESLKEKLADTETLLKNEKAKLLPLQKNVRQLVKSNWDTIPTGAKLEKCDSLKQAVIVYEAERDITDSLTEIQICSLYELIELKDQRIEACDSSFQAMKHALENSITDTKTCEKDLNKLNKKIKRKQFFNRVLGTGAAIAAIVAGTFIVTSIK